jgi:hypothetical protein
VGKVRFALIVSLAHSFEFDEKGEGCVEEKRIVARLDSLYPDAHHRQLLRLLESQTGIDLDVNLV